jgi:hypothetical protein
MKKFALVGLSFFLPALAFAQSPSTEVDSIQDLAIFITRFINNIAVPLVFTLAFIVFIIGIFQYFIAGAADEAKRDKGKSLMIYGLIGFFVMISVWGLVRILTGTIRLDNSNPGQGNDFPRATEPRIDR